MTDFRLAKKAVGAYFNDGDFICSIQVSKGNSPSARLTDAVRVGRDAFFAMFRESTPIELKARLLALITEINESEVSAEPAKEPQR